ncbi:MAG: branched-chain amino acid ABC transporter permease [Oscillospiraceae bacterium]|nr:branched-chain amino acid ABC transporter permease [Oscillospiraceae bacterium]
MVITADTIIKAAALIGALGVILGVITTVVKYFSKQKALLDEVHEVRHEQTLLCYCVLACLKGLKQQGCNGPVTKALDKMEKHLNQAAHGDETFEL